MRIKLSKILLTILLLVVLYAIIIEADYSHELVHQQIYEKYDIASSIKMKAWGRSYTVGLVPSDMDAAERSEMETLHTLNEIENYNNKELYLLFGVFVVALLVLWKNEIDS